MEKAEWSEQHPELQEGYERDLTDERSVGLYVIGQVKEYKDLDVEKLRDAHGKIKAEKDQRYIERANKNLSELFVQHAILTVHGREKYDVENGESQIVEYGDTDVMVSLGLLRDAEINTEKDHVNYVRTGQYIEGTINIDTGGKDGVFYDPATKTLFIDHHGAKSQSGTSSSEKVYDTLVNLGLLPEHEGARRLVDFINSVDTGDNPKQFERYLDSYRTVMGLYRAMNYAKLFKYFVSDQRARSGLELLSDEQIKEMGLEKASWKQKNYIERSMREIDALEKEGFAIPGRIGDRSVKILLDPAWRTETYDHVTVNQKTGEEKHEEKERMRRVPGGYLAAFHRGYDVFVFWSPDTESFIISSRVPLPKDLLPQGIPVRENMFLKPKGGTELKIQLVDFIKKVSPPEHKPSDQLKQYLALENLAMKAKHAEKKLSPADFAKFKELTSVRALYKLSNKSPDIIRTMSQDLSNRILTA